MRGLRVADPSAVNQRLGRPADTGRMIRLRSVLVAGSLLASVSAGMSQPVYKDRERFDLGAPRRVVRGEREERAAVRMPARPVTRTNPGPGYVGSDWGLGKPSYWGIGSRPDWGYWGE